MKHICCLLFLFLLSLIPSTTAATPDLCAQAETSLDFKILEAGSLEVYYNYQWSYYEPGWVQRDLVAGVSWPIFIKDKETPGTINIGLWEAAGGYYCDKPPFVIASEPTTITLLGIGLLCLAGTLRKKFKFR